MELIKWNNAKNAIMECKTIDEVKQIKDQAEAMRAYAKQVGESLQMQNDLCEIKLRAERRAGEMLKEMPKQKPGEYQRSQDVTVAPSLKEIGINKHESSRWQKIANIPEETFEEIIIETKQEQKELTESMMLKVEKEINRQKKQFKTQEWPKGKYQVIYADPPWSYNDKCKDGAIQSGGCEKYYNSMSIKELCEMDVESLTTDNCVLFLWATSPLLEDSFKLVNAWGFKYKTSFIWDKIKHNMGHYNSVRHELLLICTKGSCTPDNLKLFDSVQSIERTEHSKKPIEFYEIIETLYKGSKVELFSRDKREGWETWGNE